MKSWLIAAVAVAALAAPGLAQAAPTVRHANATSTNWSGYVASGSGQSFSDVKGSWVQPTVTCAARLTTYSSFWIGLGGASSSSSGLEQIGTDSDCRNGTPVYSAWYELIPAPSVAIPLTVEPGDTMHAEVAVTGTQITLTLTDATTGQSFTTTVTVAIPDTSSAEWIAEAPSECIGASSCRVQPLANFGTASFSSASATANGLTGFISDDAWTGTPVDLRGTAGGASATTGALGADDASFTVTAAAGATTAARTPSPTPPRVIPPWWHPTHRHR